jgi:large subunit ribosomal protein L17
VAALNDPAIAEKLFDELAPRYEERPGGYTRLYKLGRRQGDGAPLVVLELVE